MHATVKNDGGPMRLLLRALCCAGFVCCGASLSSAATITGSVKGMDGAPFKGAFVEARNQNSKITYIVLSGKDGKYRIDKLPSGEYQISIRAIGFQADPRAGVRLTSDQSSSADFSLQ